MRQFDKICKRLAAKRTWKWDEVVQISSSKEEIEFIDATISESVTQAIGTRVTDEELRDDFVDTADSLQCLETTAKIPRVSVRSRNRFFRV